MGMNVMAVLSLGIILTGVIGVLDGSFDIYGWFGAMGDGIIGMGELIIITMMAGGLLEIIKHNGGIDFIIQRLTRHVSTKRGAEMTVAGLVSFVNLCTANNTVAIITVGGIAKQIADRFGVDNRKCHGSRSGTTESYQHPAIPLLSVGYWYRCHTLYIIKVSETLFIKIYDGHHTAQLPTPAPLWSLWQDGAHRAHVALEMEQALPDIPDSWCYTLD